MAGRSIPADDERSEEAEWMAAKLAEKIIAGVCAEDREQCSIERNIGQREVQYREKYRTDRSIGQREIEDRTKYRTERNRHREGGGSER